MLCVEVGPTKAKLGLLPGLLGVAVEAVTSAADGAEEEVDMSAMHGAETFGEAGGRGGNRGSGCQGTR